MIEYDRATMIVLVNHDEVLAHLYKALCDEYCDRSKVFDDEGTSRALQQLFEDRILNDEHGIYTKLWQKSKPKPREYVQIRQHDKLTSEFQRMINVHGWRGFCDGMMRLAEVKRSEMQNGGFDNQVDNWTKVHAAIRKLKSIGIMS